MPSAGVPRNPNIGGSSIELYRFWRQTHTLPIVFADSDVSGHLLLEGIPSSPCMDPQILVEIPFVWIPGLATSMVQCMGHQIYNSRFGEK